MTQWSGQGAESGIDPKVHYALKRVFGSKDSRDVLGHLLNAVVQGSLARPICDVQILAS